MPATPRVEHIERGDFDKRNANLTGSIHIRVSFLRARPCFLEKIERQYGRSDRIWIMDRGIPTEETLASMREGEAPVRHLVGTPKGRLTQLEKVFLDLPWQEVRQRMDVKLLTGDGELYVLVRSETHRCRVVARSSGTTTRH